MNEKYTVYEIVICSLLLGLLVTATGCGKELSVTGKVIVHSSTDADGYSPEVKEKAKDCPDGTYMGCLPMQPCQCYSDQDLDYKGG